MRTFVMLAALSVVLLWPAAASAVVKQTEVTITDGGTPVGGATVTLSVPKPPPRAAAQPKRRPTATPTDAQGKTTVTYDDEDARPGWLVDITVHRGGRSWTLRGVQMTSLAAGRSLDISRATPQPAPAGGLPSSYGGIDLGAGRVRGIKDPPVGSETLRSSGSGAVFGAHFGSCALLVIACLEASIRNGESGTSQDVGGFQLKTKKALLLALALAAPFPIGDAGFYVKPFAGLGYGRFSSEVDGFRATDWMPVWHIGVAVGRFMQTPLGPTWIELYWRFDETFDRQDVTLGQVKHSNNFMGVRFSFPLGNAAALR